MPTKQPRQPPLRSPMQAEAQTLVLQEAGPEDVDRLTAMEAACFALPWTRDNVAGEMESNPFSHGWFLVRAGGDGMPGEAVAYAFMWETFETAQIARIGVLPPFRQQGLGLKFLALLKARAAGSGCEFLRLEMRASNEAARKLYEKAGLIQAGVTKRYYSDGEDAISMVAALESEETTCW